MQIKWTNVLGDKEKAECFLPNVDRKFIWISFVIQGKLPSGGKRSGARGPFFLFVRILSVNFSEHCR